MKQFKGKRKGTFLVCFAADTVKERPRCQVICVHEQKKIVL